MKTNIIGRSVIRLSTAAMLAGTLVLAGCGGGSDSTDDTTMTPPPPTAFEAALAAINAATSVADAQTAYDEVDKEAISGAEAAQLMTALAARQSELRAADQKAALMIAGDALDTSNLTSQGAVNAANLAIATLQMALDNAVDVSAADRAMYQVQLDNAKGAVERAEAWLAEQGRIDTQKTALMTAADAVSTSVMPTEDAIAAAKTANNNLEAALENAVDVSDADKAKYVTLLSNAKNAVTTAQNSLNTMGRQNVQRTALTNTYSDAKTKVDAVNDDSDDDVVMAAENAVKALEKAIADAVDLSGDAALTLAMGRLEDLQGDLTTAKNSRKTAMEEAAQTAREELIATALKLYGGIVAHADAANDADYASDTTVSNVNDNVIAVVVGSAAAVNLSEDDKTMVADNHGWKGKRFTAAPDGGGTYEAVVYSYVGEPTQGAKFSDTYEYNRTYNDDGTFATLTDGSGMEHLIETGTDAATANTVAGNVDSSAFDQSAGTKEFELSSSSSNNARVIVSGTYHGVSGTYYCKPTAADANCSATVAVNGFILGGGTWTFTAGNADHRLTDMPDEVYASYGWWLHKSEDGATYAASAFADNRSDGTAANDVAAASGVTALQGTAKYVGGAAGKYALHSTTGGTNDAGHFTATATLEANFGTDVIKGTIDNFVGPADESGNWSVELKASNISDAGVIAGDPADSTDTGPQETVWSIDGTAAAANGQWSGTLYENGDDGVPSIGTGTFYSTYGRDAGKMVGAFGVNKQ